MEITQGNNSSIAYTLRKTGFPILAIKNSANAWWLDQNKMVRLIQAFRLDCTIPEACFFAGITLRQYKYFATQHPVINEIRECCEAALILMVRKSVVEKAADSYWTAIDYLARKRPHEFGKEKRITYFSKVRRNEREFQKNRKIALGRVLK